MANFKLLGCGALVGILGVALIVVGGLIGQAVDDQFKNAIDSIFIDEQKDSDDTCIKCEEDDEDEKCTPTCEEDQIKWFLKERNPNARRRWTHLPPDAYDYWVYTVGNPDEVIEGAKPKMDYVDKFELYEIPKYEQVGEMDEGKLEFKRVTNRYRIRDVSQASIDKAKKIIDTTITVPHVSYSVVTNLDSQGGNIVHIVLAGGVQGFLSALGGMLAPMVGSLAPAFPAVEASLGPPCWAKKGSSETQRS